MSGKIEIDFSFAKSGEIILFGSANFGDFGSFLLLCNLTESRVSIIVTVSGTTLIITQHDATIAIPIRDRVVANRDPRSDAAYRTELRLRMFASAAFRVDRVQYEHTTELLES